MASQLHRVKIAPKGMGLNDFVAMQEGYFTAEGLDVEFDWKTFRGTQSSWKGLDYLQRPQDRPYTQDKSDVIQGACVWGSICNASAGMGPLVRGSASVTRESKASTLKVSDAIFRGDLLQTASDATLGITFNDATTFSLQPNSQVTVDDFVYQERGKHNRRRCGMTG